MCGKIWNSFTGFCRRYGRQILYYACLAAVLCAAAVCAERIRNESPAEAQTASAEAEETIAPQPTQAPPRLPEDAQILRRFAAEPQWNEWLGLYETHSGTDVHFENGEVVSISDGTVCGIRRDSIEIASGEIIYTYCGIEPAPEIVPGKPVQTGDALGIETGGEESWMPRHVHLEARKDGKRVDLTEIL